MGQCCSSSGSNKRNTDKNREFLELKSNSKNKRSTKKNIRQEEKVRRQENVPEEFQHVNEIVSANLGNKSSKDQLLQQNKSEHLITKKYETISKPDENYLQDFKESSSKKNKKVSTGDNERNLITDADYINPVPDDNINKLSQKLEKLNIKTNEETLPNKLEAKSPNSELYETNKSIEDLLGETKNLIETIKLFWGPSVEAPKIEKDIQNILTHLQKIQKIDTSADIEIQNAIEKIIKHQELLVERLPIIKNYELQDNNHREKEKVQYSEDAREIMKISSQVIGLYKTAVKSEWNKELFQEQMKKCVIDLEKIKIKTDDKVSIKLKDNLIYFCNDIYKNQRIQINFTASV